ncbi:MAG: SIS domain-containing protein [Chloroflexi bacterium]|nr:SIS domain-containing protein [Chloroflexota bacterium]
MACDLAKVGIGNGNRRIRAIALTDNAPLTTAWANDSAYKDVFAEQLLNLVQPGDLVIAISRSGNSPNVLKAVEVAKRAGVTTVGFTGRPGGRLKDIVDMKVVVPSMRIERAEDGHLILDHVIAVALREGVAGRGEGETGGSGEDAGQGDDPRGWNRDEAETTHGSSSEGDGGGRR